jgi:hypothetical protein
VPGWGWWAFQDIGGDGVEAHGFGHAQAIAPVRAGHAGVVHFAGDDLDGFAVVDEAAIGNAEGRLLRARGTEGGESKEHEDCAEEREPEKRG